MKILFIIDPVEDLQFPWDTTSFIAAECKRQKMAVYFCTPAEMFWENGGVWAKVWQARVNPFKGFSQISSPKRMPLSKMNVVWMRKDPPIDTAYIQTCQLLTLIPKPTVVLNNPHMLINKNEKLFALEFKKWIPKTIVSRSLKQLLAFLSAQKGKMVIKPTSNRGGVGVELVKRSDPHLKKKLLGLTQNESEFIIAQQFMPTALTDGDKRIVLIDGKPIGAILRNPNENTLTGKKLPYLPDSPTTITKRELKLCQALAPTLKKCGLFFVGIDVIDEKLIEINLTSPAGFPELNKLYGGCSEEKVVNQLFRKYFRGSR